MCGICGGLSWERPLGADELDRMLRTLVHRGPDDEGKRLDGPAALGARRLAIIDLRTGHQPIGNEDGTVWVVQNGEIYNHLELRQELEARGHRFRTSCDTEVLVHLYEERGEDFVAPLAGMFAAAVWDARAGRLVLARDRFGKKPLYYAPSGDGLLFASEIKALLASGRVAREVDWAALGGYFAKLYIGGEGTVYRGVRQLLPGHVLTAGRDGLRTARYWDPWSFRPRPGPFREEELVEELGGLLRQAVRIRLRSDVPLGCFLSGGIDSSLVAALACEASGGRLRTFTVGFDRTDYDESPAARELAERLGTEHREFRLEGGAGGLDAVAGRIPEMFDQPFGDSSAVPTWQVAGLTRQEVTVALSGDGGDEVFGGYRRYLARRWAERYNRLPRALRRPAGALADALGGSARAYGGGLRSRLRRFAAYARQIETRPAASRQEYFSPAMLAAVLQPEALARLAGAGPAGDPPEAARLDPADAAMRRDMTDYLPDDILAKVDRTSMDVSLEARAPLLDHRVAEFMLSLPVDWRLRGATGKYLLRRFAATVLPARVLRRPKHGFAIPLGPWFVPGGGGRSRLEALSAGGALGSVVRPEAVRELLGRHAAGRDDFGEHLWALVVLGDWMEKAGVTA
ncbi:MAG TPA: asparagine synthase (glutamine-hydrolyzing) [Planctomycetota bacterium]|nr:asparagine synthase (glutamine-hydrolyzing) [Planctomycetota bacterium]